MAAAPTSLPGHGFKERPPRVRIRFDVETGGSTTSRELPFVVAVLADFAAESPTRPHWNERRPIAISAESFDDVMEGLQPTLSLRMPPLGLAAGESTSGSEGAATATVLCFRCMADFEPLGLIAQVPALQALMDARRHLRDLQCLAQTRDAWAAALTGWARDGVPAPVDLDAPSAAMSDPSAGLSAFASLVLPLPADQSVDAGIDAAVARLDSRLSQAVNAILHAPNFQRLEATWRGLDRWISRLPVAASVEVRLFDATWRELSDDLARAVDADQSHLFKWLYEAEYGTLGGTPYGLLVSGFELGRSAEDVDFVTRIAAIAAAAHAPLLTAAAPSLFGLQSFRDLDRPRDLSKIFEGLDAVGWSAFRDSDPARFVAVVLPHVLARLPYGMRGQPVRDWPFEEDRGTGPTPDPQCLVWSSAAYALAARITDAFARDGWPAAIRGIEHGGLVDDLPLYHHARDDGRLDLVCPSEVSLTERRERELNDLGFIGLCHVKDSDRAAFLGSRSAHRPQRHVSIETNANAALLLQLPYVLVACRFVHTLQAIVRARLGTFLTVENVEAMLNDWISRYVLLDDTAPPDVGARFPLREAQVVVTADPGQPGAFHASLFLRPHFQLVTPSACIRLDLTLPQ